MHVPREGCKEGEFTAMSQVYHINNEGRSLKCGDTSGRCPYKNNPHGKLSFTNATAEVIAHEKDRKRKKNNRNDVGITATSNANITATRTAPPGGVSTLTSAKNIASTPLKPGDKKVVGANGKVYILPPLKERPLLTEEDYLLELEKQRIFLDRAKRITDRDERIANRKTPAGIRKKLEQELEAERRAAKKLGVPWDVPHVRALWEAWKQTAKKHGTTAHWPRLTKGQRQITADQMSPESLKKFDEHVKNINLANLTPSKHVHEKLAEGKLAGLDAEDIFATIENYKPQIYQVTGNGRHTNRAITISSDTYSRVIAPEKGAKPVPCNLNLVISLDEPNKDGIITAYWNPVGRKPSGSGIRFRDRWLKVT